MTDYRNDTGRNPRAATLRRGDYLDDPQARRINKALLARRSMTLVEIGFGEHVVALMPRSDAMDGPNGTSLADLYDDHHLKG